MNLNTDMDYKPIFLRFLKEKGFYSIWLQLMKINDWNKSAKIYFNLVKAPLYISTSFNEYRIYDELNDFNKYDFIGLDFEWKVLCSHLNKENEPYLLNFIHSHYFSKFYIILQS